MRKPCWNNTQKQLRIQYGILHSMSVFNSICVLYVNCKIVICVICLCSRQILHLVMEVKYVFWLFAIKITGIVDGSNWSWIFLHFMKCSFNYISCNIYIYISYFCWCCRISLHLCISICIWNYVKFSSWCCEMIPLKQYSFHHRNIEIIPYYLTRTQITDWKLMFSATFMWLLTHWGPVIPCKDLVQHWLRYGLSHDSNKLYPKSMLRFQ